MDSAAGQMFDKTKAENDQTAVPSDGGTVEDNSHPDQSIWGESSLHQTRGAPSAQKAWMISARRCSMVIRRAYWLISALVLMPVSLVMMTVGASRPRPVTMSWRTVPG